VARSDPHNWNKGVSERDLPLGLRALNSVKAEARNLHMLVRKLANAPTVNDPAVIVAAITTWRDGIERSFPYPTRGALWGVTAASANPLDQSARATPRLLDCDLRAVLTVRAPEVLAQIFWR
jgi:hypothetical protein